MSEPHDNEKRLLMLGDIRFLYVRALHKAKDAQIAQLELDQKVLDFKALYNIPLKAELSFDEVEKGE